MEYQKFLAEAKEFVLYMEKRIEEKNKAYVGNTYIKGSFDLKQYRDEVKKLSIYQDILKYLEKVAKLQLADRIISGEENAFDSYLKAKEQKINETIVKTKSKNKLAIMKRELARIQQLKGLDKKSFLREITPTLQEIEETAKSVCRGIVNSNDYTQNTKLNSSSSGSGFLNFTDGNLIAESNILLAQELLSGNTENYEKLEKVKNLKQKQRKISSDRGYISLAEQIDRYIMQCQRFLSFNNDSDAYNANLSGEHIVDSARIVIKQSGLIESKHFNDENGQPLFSPEMFDKTFGFHFSSIDKNISNVQVNIDKANQLKALYTHPLIVEKSEAYKSELENTIGEITETIPENVRNADVDHMSRIVYYGRGRIGEEPTQYDSKDATFDMTRIALAQLLKFDKIYKESKQLMPEQVLSSEQIDKMYGGVHEQIDSYIGRKL